MNNFSNLAKMIDHTILKANATESDIEKLCQEAKQYEFASVCVNPYWVSFASNLLKDTNVKVCTVIGFPLGATSSESKAYETEIAILQGADEVDMVINVGAMKNNKTDIVENDILSVVNSARKTGKTQNKNIIVKVILETCYLTKDEIKNACICAKNAGADFVKTSTGFGTGGTTTEDVALMKQTVGETMQVKASGGIRDYETAIKMIEAGASRIGTSSGITICTK
ncbi:MAG: deoxyribose-phosphate aldolase [Spirochaetaceae bacterium]|nr:deoxyribose-phosphate aldolase [Spirochaetaceae bacterium]